jgi:hypothetical protein
MAVDLLNIEGLEALDHQGPIVMVNLMRFHERSLDGDGSGWDAYLRYSAITVPMIKARGGSARNKAINGTIWRWCIILRSPRSST